MWDDPNQPPYGQPRQPGQQRPYGRNIPGNFQDPNSMPTDPDSLPGANPGNPGGPGYGGNAGNAGYGRYNADGTPFQPPAYAPDPMQYPAGGHAAHWPTPQAPIGPVGPAGPVQQRPPQPPPPPARPRYQAPPKAPRRPPEYDDYDARPARQQYAAQPAGHARHRSPAGISLPHLPIAHIILVVGVLVMGFALSQAWGVAADGTAVYIRDFTNARIQQTAGVDTGALAVKTANFLFGAVVVLSAVLILFNLVVTLLNKIIGLSGCATLLFFPVLWGAATLLFIVLVAAAGFAGVGSLGNLPLVRDHGFAIATVAHHAIGFYAWCGGIVAVFIGMLGQLALRRR